MGSRLRRAAGCALWSLALLSLVPATGRAQPVALPVPPGVLPPAIPDDNPPTAAKVELGKRLYFDARLSADGTVACATCHDPRQGFADPRAVSVGVGGATGVRNSPTVLNAAFLAEQFWDGRAKTLEEQALQPLVNPVEMAMPDHAAVETKLRGIPDYPPLFAAAFGDDRVTIERVGQAIASFERTLLSLDAPIDRFLAGDAKAIPEAAQRGWALYNGKARCNTCHGHVGVLPLLTDELYHNIGVAAKDVSFEDLARQVEGHPEDLAKLSHEPGLNQLGRFLVTKERKDIGAFKTPQLRNVALTAPYMHDGSEKTLADVIEFYDRGGNPNPWLDGGMRPLGLTPQEKSDLVALLETFTSGDLEKFELLGALVPRR
ncbi:MAG TPA: cytochrome c peroxidase [Myxococcota bacterium]|nr:cytochrome c peroxidase [Myxococcota bacterium]